MRTPVPPLSKTLCCSLFCALLLSACQSNHEQNCNTLMKEASLAAKFDDASALYKKAIVEAKESTNRMQLPRVLFALARLDEKNSKWPDAETNLRQALEEFDKIRDDPSVPKLYLRETVDEYVTQVASLARVLVAQKRYEEADEVFNKALKINQEQLGELMERRKIAIDYAQALRAAGRDEDAYQLEFKIEAHEYRTKDWYPLFHAALQHFRKGKAIARREFALARHCVPKGHPLSDPLLRLYFWSTACELVNHQPESALKCANQLTRMSKDRQTLPELDLVVNGVVLSELNRTEESRSCFRRAADKSLEKAVQTALTLDFTFLKNNRKDLALKVTRPVVDLSIERKREDIEHFSELAGLTSALLREVGRSKEADSYVKHGKK